MMSSGLNYWLDIKNLKAARKKILTDENWIDRTKDDMKRINDWLGIKDTDHVVDFGCGIGRLLKEVALMCHSIVGVDVSSEMLAYALEECRGLDNILLMNMGDETKINISDGQTDKIYSILVMQHIDKPKAFRILAEFNRILKPHGKVLIQYPNVMNINFYLSYMELRYSLQILNPLMEFYSKPELEMIFTFNGFRIIKIQDDGKDFYVIAEKIGPVKQNDILGIGTGDL